MYGDYELVREIAVGPTALVYLASKKGRDYVLKVFRPLALAEEERQNYDNPNALGEDVQLKFLQAAELQRKAAQHGSRRFAPIYDALHTGESAWYATDYYRRSSLKRLIQQDFELDAANLRALFVKILEALLDLQGLAKRSHGNLKSTNVLLGGSVGSALGSTPVFLTDLQPGTEADATLFELRDLRALGELLLQLVTGREIASPDEYNFPIEPSPAWSKLGDEKDYWLGLCNRLVDPRLSLQTTTLRQLAQEIKPPEPWFQRSLRWVAVAIAQLSKRALALKPSETWKAKWRARRPVVGKILAVTGAVVILSLLVWRIIPSKAERWQRREKQLQEALTRISNELSRASSDLQVREWDKAEGAATHGLIDVTNALRRAGGEPRFERWVNQLKNTERSLRDVHSNAMSGALACNRSRENALAAEKRGAWTEALTHWTEAQTNCPSAASIPDGIAFVRAITNAQGLLRQARDSAKSQPEQAATLCETALAELRKVESLALTMVRKSAVAGFSNQVAEARASAETILAQRQQKQNCDTAKTAARAVETNQNWSMAVSRWQTARSSCPGDAEVTDGLRFAQAMTNALEMLDKAQRMTNDQPEQARAPCERALMELSRVASLARSGVRSNAFQELTNRLAQLQREAEVLVAKATRQKECQNAKQQAQKAEETGNWADALKNWRKAETNCLGEPGITNDIAFTRAMKETKDFLAAAQDLMSRNPDEARQRSGLALQELGKLPRGTLSDTRKKALASLTTKLEELANLPPTVNVPSSVVVALGQKATLNGTVSDDGLPRTPGQVTLKWSQEKGPVRVKFDNDQAATTTASFDQEGAYQLRLTAYDGASSNSAAMQVTVNRLNQPPVVQVTNPSNDALFTAGEDIRITATAHDPDGQVVKVMFFAGTNKLWETNQSGTNYSYTWTNAPAGRHFLQAQATDDAGASSNSAVVQVTVKRPNQPPEVQVTGPLNGASFAAGENIVITATANDPDGQVAKVVFFAGTNKLGEINQSAKTYRYTWTNAPAGRHFLQAQATDDAGVSSNSAVMEVTVKRLNQLPVVQVTSPTNGATFTAGADIPITATATDPDGQVAKVVFFAGTNKLWETSKSATHLYSCAWTNAPAGTHLLKVQATDEAGASSNSMAVEVTVKRLNQSIVVVNEAELQEINVEFEAFKVWFGLRKNDGTVLNPKRYERAGLKPGDLAKQFGAIGNGRDWYDMRAKQLIELKKKYNSPETEQVCAELIKKIGEWP